MSGRRTVKHRGSNPKTVEKRDKGTDAVVESDMWYMWYMVYILTLDSNRPGLKAGLEPLWHKSLICIKGIMSVPITQGYHDNEIGECMSKCLVVSCLQNAHHPFIPSLSIRSWIRAALSLLSPVEFSSGDSVPIMGWTFKRTGNFCFCSLYALSGDSSSQNPDSML